MNAIAGDIFAINPAMYAYFEARAKWEVVVV